MRTLAVALLLLMFAAPAWCGEDSVVLYLDGARLVHRAVAGKGYLNVPLPADMIPGSLRVTPLDGCTVLRVEETEVLPDRKGPAGAASLSRRRDALSDHLEALRAREEIFKAAAKSQSSRAPRRTKTNPDPMEAIRKGTDFAVARLDATRAAVRRTERELAAIEGKLTAAGKLTSAGRCARIWLSRANGGVRIAYLVSGLRWTPRYDFRLSGDGSVRVDLRAGLPHYARGASLSVVPLKMADARGVDLLPTPVSPNRDLVDSFKLDLTMEEPVTGPVSALSFCFNNTSGRTLPAGEAYVFWKGEYMGRSGFETCGPGVSRTLAFGR